MPTPIEQRKDIFEISTDIDLMICYRKAILEKMPRMWVLIHHNKKTGNYGLEVNNGWGAQCSSEEVNTIRDILMICRGKEQIEIIKKSPKKRKKATKEEMVI